MSSPNVRGLNEDKEQVFSYLLGSKALTATIVRLSYSRIIIRELKEISFAPTPIDLCLLLSLWFNPRLINTGLSKF